MTKTKKKIRRTLIAWGCFLLGGLLLLLLFWSGRLWFNMPSKKKYPVRGVDVSHYQGTVDWEQIAKQGIRFAFLKATEGSGTGDDCFVQNWENARRAGLAVGAYHFFSFDSAAETQADNFCNAVPQEDDALPPVIDLEFYRTEDLPPDEEVQENLRILLARFSSHYGKKPIIYTTHACLERYLAELDGDYTLWIRSTLTKPSAELSPAWTFWQYNPRGRLSGYEGDERFIDLNIFRGSEADFTRFASGG